MRRGIRLRKAVPRFPAGPLPGPGCARRPEAPDPGRAARRVKWLTPGGLVAACAVGAGVTWRLGWPGLALLAAFFLTGSILTQLAERRGPSRNARQVLANGGIALVAALLGSWAGAAGAIAAAERLAMARHRRREPRRDARRSRRGRARRARCAALSATTS